MIRKFGQSTIFAMILSLSLHANANINDSATKLNWNYLGDVGPNHWGKLDPSFALCSTGKSQSPINIVPKNTSSSSSVLKINYKNAPIEIVDDGTTVLQIGTQQAVINDGQTIQLNFAANSGETIIYKGAIYRLVQLHLHSPSENQINRQAFPLEIHFVHQGNNGAVVVMAVLVQGGETNTALQSIIAHLPKEPRRINKFTDVLNPSDLLPNKRDYYSFQGSLTTPPCTEGVNWIVMANTITATPAQILQLRYAIGEPNSRYVQPLNKRIVQYSATQQG